MDARVVIGLVGLSFWWSSPIVAEPSGSLELAPVPVVAGPEAATSSAARPEAADGPAADAGDWLRRFSGVNASRMGGRGLDPSIRGQDGERLNVHLDGARVFSGCPNRMDPPTTYSPLGSLDRVTVHRGVQTLRYGAGGSGGTVLLERARPDGSEPGSEVLGDLYGRYAGNGHARTLGGNLLARSPAGYMRALGELNAATHYRDGNGERIWSAHESRHGGLMLGWTPSKDARIELGYEKAEERDVHYAGAGMDAPESDNTTYSLRTRHGIGDGHLETELHYSQVEHVMDNFSLRPEPPMSMRAPSTSDTFSARLEAEQPLDRTLLTFGLNVLDNQRDATLFNEDNGREVAFLWPEATIRQYGVFAEAEHPFGERNRLSGGVRLDQAEARLGRANDTPDLAAGWSRSPAELYDEAYGFDDDPDRDDLLLGAFLRHEHDLTAELSLFASASRSERVADATERYLARNAQGGESQWIGNPDLAPEVHHQLDLGVLRRSQWLDYEFSLFVNEVDDYIYRDQVTFDANGEDGTRDLYRNVRARLVGGEAEAALRYAEVHETRLTLSARRGTNRSDDEPLARIAPLDGALSQQYHRGPWKLRAVMRFSDNQTRLNEAAGEQETSGWALLDLAAHYRAGGLELAVGVENLFDRAYRDFLNRNRATADPLLSADSDDAGLGLREPGRSLWSSAEYRF